LQETAQSERPTGPRSCDSARIELIEACRASARYRARPARVGRLHRGEQDCNAEVGPYPRMPWSFWNATRRLRIPNCRRGTIGSVAGGSSDDEAGSDR
jgi:hypothetical protein